MLFIVTHSGDSASVTETDKLVAILPCMVAMSRRIFLRPSAAARVNPSSSAYSALVISFSTRRARLSYVGATSIRSSLRTRVASSNADKEAPRSINLATITEIRLDGMAHAYEVAA